MSSQPRPTLEEALKDQKAGPTPITIEEYRKRQKCIHEEPKQEQTSKPGRLKKRGGKQVKQRKEVAKLHRMAAMAVTQQEKNLCLSQIKEIHNNKKGGPEPITIEEFCKRLKSELEEPKQEQCSKPRRPKKRGGKKVKQRIELAKLHRMAAMAVTQQEKNLCLSQIKEIHNNKKGGPEPITIEEFCKRLKSELEEPKQQQTSKPGRLKKRGGKQMKERIEVAKLHQMAAMAVSKKEKKIFLSRIKEIHKNKGGDRNQHKP